MSARRKPLPEPVTSRGSEIEQGIRYAVDVLRAGGIDTFESCEGGEGHACALPTVRFHGGAYEGYRAFAVAMERGLPVRHLRYAFTATNGHLESPCWELVFDDHVRFISDCEEPELAPSAATLPRAQRARAQGART
jgi:hypothetical protein